MTKELKIKILTKCVLIALLIAILLPCFFNVSYALVNKNEFDKTNVFDDLNSGVDGDNRFDFGKYPFDENGTIQIVNVVEYCYSYYMNKQENYGLYIYVYNPQDINIDVLSSNNTIQLATKYNSEGKPSEYNKLTLKYCNKSEEGNYKNLFYKFRVSNPSSILSRLNNSPSRQYDISGFQIIAKGDKLPKDYEIGGTYTFTGYSQGYGKDKNADSNLNCSVTDLEIVHPTIGSTYFRTESSSLGKDHQNQLNTAYFQVPNRFFDRYGGLQKIHADWWEYKTTPMVVTNSQLIYDEFMKQYGAYGQYNENQKIAFAYNYSYVFDTHFSTEKMDWDFNIEHKNRNDIGFIGSSTSKSESYVLPYFYKGTWDYDKVKLGEVAVDRSKIIKTMDDYKFNHKGYIPDCYKNISRDLFDSKVDSGRKEGYNNQNIDGDIPFDMISYGDSHNFWDKLFDFGFGKKPDDESFLGKRPIEILGATDMLLPDGEFAKKFLVEEKAAADIKKNYKLFNKTVLFRFAQTDYFSSWVTTFWNLDRNKTEAFVSSQTVFLNFDIIDLTFNKDGVYTVIPAVSNPIDIVGSITFPRAGDSEFPWWLILAIILTILLLPILVPILTPVVKLIIKIVILPFKAIAWIIKACFGRGNTEKSSNKT